MIEAPLTEEAYRLLRKRVHVELGVSLALLWMKEEMNTKCLNWGEAHREALEKLLSSASVDEIMKTCRVESADGQD